MVSPVILSAARNLAPFVYCHSDMVLSVALLYAVPRDDTIQACSRMLPERATGLLDKQAIGLHIGLHKNQAALRVHQVLEGLIAH